MRAGRFPWPEGVPAPASTAARIERAAWGRPPEPRPVSPPSSDAPPYANHPLVRARRHHQAVALDVADCTVMMSPSEVLALISDLEKLAVVLGWLEPR